MKLASAFAAGAVFACLVALAVLYLADYEVVDSSSGDSDLVSVPNVLGQEVDDAEAELSAADLGVTVSDLSIASKYGQTPEEFGATVRAQNPDVGTDVKPDTTVTIAVE